MAKTRDELIERLMAHQSGTNLAEMEKSKLDPMVSLKPFVQSHPIPH